MTQASSATDRFVTEASRIPYWRVEIGQAERDLVVQTMDRRSFSVGPVTAEMEAELARQLDVPYALCTTSGTMALTMALAVHGIGPGDEVLVPTRTFIATAHAPLLLGAKPVLVDCRADTTTIDPDAAAARITSRTRAIIPAHLNGRACDMENILRLARRHKLVVVEDTCQALFSRHPLGYLGTIGDVGCFSFSMVKLAVTGQGGALTTRSKDVYERLKRFRDHGVKDLVSRVHVEPGGNFKFNDLQASIGLVQLQARGHKVGRVNEIYDRYRRGLHGLSFLDVLPVDVDNGEVALWTEVVSEQRDAIMDYLAADGIQTRKFHLCCHSAPHLRDGNAFPNSERFGRTGFNLPCGPDMPLEFVDQTIETLRRYGRRD